ncbi:MAG: HAMP domain-containing histidine kinase [Bacteroidetes bacterium]|nr:HAMP domain-containing histidine kinase [Bacteroidota bacterium]
MIKQNLTIITIIISLFFVALVGVQLFWIHGAIDLKKDEFRRDVREALDNTVDKVEKITNAKKIKSKINLYKQGLVKRTIPDSSSNNDKISVKILEDFSIDSNGVITSTIKEKQYGGNAANNIVDFPVEFADTTSDYAKLKNELLEKRIQIFDDLFDELVSINVYKQSGPPIDTLMLDSILRSEMHQKGIYADYKIKIRQAQKEDSMRWSTHKNEPRPSGRHSFTNMDTNKHIFRVNLSPNNVFVVPQFLIIEFPDEENYLLRTMWIVLSVSAVIILSLVWAFYFTISTIRQQKKYTEIKNDFISNMTHEFKTPIATIALASEMLSDNSIGKTPEKMNRFTKMIRDENKRLGSLVENILQTSILDKGNFKLQRINFDLHETILAAVEKIHLQLEQKNGTLHTHLKADPHTLFADKTHITNIVVNLLDNALKYSKEYPKISIRTENVQGGILLAIEDNGVGISKEDAKKIFDQFFRVSTGNVHNIKGFGLGLSYVQAIVKKHEGQISVESELGKGSTFTIFLPFKPVNSN